MAASRARSSSPMPRRAVMVLVAVGLPALLAAQSGELFGVLANGYRFAYRDQGQGRPVVFVHGSLVDYRAWAGTLAEPLDSTRSIAYSRRYYYPNPWRPDDPPCSPVKIIR